MNAIQNQDISAKPAQQQETRGFFAGRDIASLVQSQASGTLTAADIVYHASAAIARLDPVLNAFAHVDFDAALAVAHELDAERAQGRLRGPLHGIPIAIKDLIDVIGMPTTMGAAHFLGHYPAADAQCVARPRAAGAIIIGKTVTHEFAYGSTGDRSVQGPVRNPWRTTRMTGDSSAGSGAAVAAGMVPAALGTDTGGSVRIPAALCGVVGFKPTHGLVSVEGVFPLSPSLDDVGALAGNVPDCALLMQVMAGLDGSAAPSATVRALWVDNAPFAIDDPAVTACVHKYAERLPGAMCNGAVVPAKASALQNAIAVIQKSEAYATHAELIEQAPQEYGPEVLKRLRASAEVKGWELVRAWHMRERLQQDFADLFTEIDVLAMPTVAITAPALQQRRIDGPDGAHVSVSGTLLGLTNPWNVLGLPAISLPAGFVNGLPVGLQLVAAAGKDSMLLALAARLPAIRPE